MKILGRQESMKPETANERLKMVALLAAAVSPAFDSWGDTTTASPDPVRIHRN